MHVTAYNIYEIHQQICDAKTSHNGQFDELNVGRKKIKHRKSIKTCVFPLSGSEKFLNCPFFSVTLFSFVFFLWLSVLAGHSVSEVVLCDWPKLCAIWADFVFDFSIFSLVRRADETRKMNSCMQQHFLIEKQTVSIHLL